MGRNFAAGQLRIVPRTKNNNKKLINIQCVVMGTMHSILCANDVKNFKPNYKYNYLIIFSDIWTSWDVKVTLLSLLCATTCGADTAQWYTGNSTCPAPFRGFWGLAGSRMIWEFSAYHPSRHQLVWTIHLHCKSTIFWLNFAQCLSLILHTWWHTGSRIYID